MGEQYVLLNETGFVNSSIRLFLFFIDGSSEDCHSHKTNGTGKSFNDVTQILALFLGYVTKFK